MTFISRWAECVALEMAKERIKEFLPLFVKACGGRFSEYVQGKVPFLGLFPKGVVERALGGGWLVESSADGAQMHQAFPGLRDMSSDDGIHLVIELTKALQKAPGVARTILALDTYEIAGVFFEVIEERYPELKIDRLWVVNSITNFKVELRPYIGEE